MNVLRSKDTLNNTLPSSTGRLLPGKNRRLHRLVKAELPGIQRYQGFVLGALLRRPISCNIAFRGCVLKASKKASMSLEAQVIRCCVCLGSV
eukprot:Skav215722  [mRNA]  locus=scaffold2573:689133:693637:+ [translate_table: standard]